MQNQIFQTNNHSKFPSEEPSSPPPPVPPPRGTFHPPPTPPRGMTPPPIISQQYSGTYMNFFTFGQLFSIHF